MKKRVGVISLGCDKNRVDTETMLYCLSGSGYELTQKPEEADVIIVNTCAFIASAREEAIDTILSSAALKPEKLVVTGCLPQKYAGELYDELPEVDAFLGIDSYGSIVPLLNRLYETGERVNAVGQSRNGALDKRVLTTPYHYAYLKIADGCNNRCTYCTIPSIRGRYASRPMGSLCKEAEELVGQGVKELILVAQDTTKYGTDLYGESRLVPLLKELSKIDGIYRLRLLYCYPENVTDSLICELAENEKVANYIDIPLQHADDGILKRMGRRTSRAQISALIEKLRENVKDIAIRSTFIAGFPGETDAAFQNLLSFLKEYKLDNAGFFAYSQEGGTPAARLPDQISEDVKEERVRLCYETQRKISLENNRRRVGRTVEVLLDGADFEKGAFYGRGAWSAPEIDGVVYVNGDGVLESGERYRVRLTGCTDYDFTGEVLHEPAE